MKKCIGAAVLSLLALAACGVNTMPTKDAWFTQHYIIMQDFERTAYRALSTEGRKAFQELFWAVRTQDAQAMYRARLDYVIKNFWKENSQQPWNTDRSRVYLLNGSPASIDYDQNVSFAQAMPGQMAQATDRTNEDVGANRAEVWIYPYDKYFIKYTFAFVQPYQWKITQTTGNRYLGELETFNKNITFGIVDLEKYKQELADLQKTK
ncbi:MAG TPA: GWxTD domain-containing protein [Candidatus Latescibacteria bacterium]|nr:GWxTD domain-containing protein [Candidatus Latescibacterota bacterium]